MSEKWTIKQPHKNQRKHPSNHIETPLKPLIPGTLQRHLGIIGSKYSTQDFLQKVWKCSSFWHQTDSITILWHVLHIRIFKQCFYIVWPWMWPAYRQGVSRLVVWVQGSAHSSLCKHTSKKTTKKRNIAGRRVIVIIFAFGVGVVTYKLFLIISYKASACDSIRVLRINRLCVADLMRAGVECQNKTGRF